MFPISGIGAGGYLMPRWFLSGAIGYAACIVPDALGVTCVGCVPLYLFVFMILSEMECVRYYGGVLYAGRKEYT